MKFILFIITITSLILLNACGGDSFSESDAIKLTLVKIQELNEPHLLVDFPKKAGTKTMKVSVGGMYGSKTKLQLTTQVKIIDKGVYDVILTKNWNTIVNGEKVLSYWVFRVKHDSVTQLREEDKDDLMAVIG